MARFSCIDDGGFHASRRRRGPALAAPVQTKHADQTAKASEATAKMGSRLAGGPGFEPRLSESESEVLPLNYPPISGSGELALTHGLCNLRDACLAPCMCEILAPASTSDE